jgi:hypothetical protein
MKINERAVQLWSVLVFAARMQKILSYSMVQELTGIFTPAIGKVLEPIQSYCKREKLPPLTVLVINEETGLPGVGFTEAQDIFSAQARVFVYDWYRRKAPQPNDFL